MLRFLLTMFAVLFVGCAQKGFNRGALKEQVGVTKPVYDDKEIENAYNKKPNLPKPFKVAVYFKSPKEGYNIPKWRWTEQDKELFEDVAKQLKSDGIVSDVFPIVSSIVTNEDLRSLRLVAAKHQADALLIISGGTQIDRYANNLGWTYLFIAPVLFVPGSEADTLFVSNATLWDVKNEYLYLTTEAEATKNETYVPVWGRNDKDLVNDAKVESLTKLKNELVKMIKGSKL
jgi:hypothetical protein